MSLTPLRVLLSNKLPSLNPKNHKHIIEIEQELQRLDQKVERHTNDGNTASKLAETSGVISRGTPLNAYRPFYENLPHRLSSEVRFLFHLPYPADTSGRGTGIDGHDGDEFECWYEKDLIARVLHVQELVPQDKLVLQWDCTIDGNCAAPSALPMEAFLDRLERVVSHISAGVLLSFQLHYMSQEREGSDLSVVVEYANAIAERIERMQRVARLKISLRKSRFGNWHLDDLIHLDTRGLMLYLNIDKILVETEIRDIIHVAEKKLAYPFGVALGCNVLREATSSRMHKVLELFGET